jgi:hypothetical protein
MKCVPASCGDGTKDGSETDVDCGGGQCGGCPAGDTCNVGGDCASVVCKSGLCKAPTDSDGVKNDSETDVDCGGGVLASGMKNPMSDGAPACKNGSTCAIGEDCMSGVCASGPVLKDNLDGGPTSDGSGTGALTCQPPTFHDGVTNDSETDVDCGGALTSSGQPNSASDGAPACGAGKKCTNASDCQSLVCTSGVCAAPSATDMVQNDSETDVDCGGGYLPDGSKNPASDGAPACPDTKRCKLGTDCVDLVCAPAPLGSGAGSADGGPIDCSSGTSCTCQPATDTDGVKNDSETDIDCGGGFVSGGGANTASDGAPLCQMGQSCVLGTDCFAGVCNDNMEAGGPPVDCPAGDSCQCQAPSPTDTVENGGETDVDCGGATAPGSDSAPACAAGLKCLISTDCQSHVCTPGTLTCALPTPTDGVKNGGETDVDCGGTPAGACTPSATADCAPACPDTKSCLLDTDCKSAFCSTGLLSGVHTCVAGQSCKGLITPAAIMDITSTLPVNPTGTTTDVTGTEDPNGAGQSAGLDTCGFGETTDGTGQTHESCCKSLLIASTGTRLDKYEVTSGRIRQWIESVNAWSQAAGKGAYNLQAWVEYELANDPVVGPRIAAQMPTTGANSVIGLFSTSANGSDPLNLVQELGGTTIDPGHPSGVQGCFMGYETFGASTYWWDADGEAQVGSPPRPFTQDYYDTKPLNCAPYWIGAAFCAWDGGRLADDAEYTAIWTGSYPWVSVNQGTPAIATPQLGPGAGDGALDTTAAAHDLLITQLTVDYYNGNLGSPGGGQFYFFPSQNDGTSQSQTAVYQGLTYGTDLSPMIASPGRFSTDTSSATGTIQGLGVSDSWADVGANIMEVKEVVSPWTANGTEFCDTTGTGGGLGSCSTDGKTGVIRATNGFNTSWTGGSWEGHPILRENYTEASITQYGKAGYRCARAAEP